MSYNALVPRRRKNYDPSGLGLIFDPAPRSWSPLARAAAAAGVLGGLAVGFAALTRGRSPSVRRPSPAREPDCNLVTPTGGTVAGIEYLERIRGNADPESKLPMVIAFHSRGATAAGMTGMLKGIGPARLIIPKGPHRTAGGGNVWWTVAIRDDEDDVADAFLEMGDKMAAFIYDIVRCRPTEGRPIVTGSSQGGEMAYLMTNVYPDLVRGGVAVAGWIPEPLWNVDMAPTLGLHGDRDNTVPYAWAKEFADTMIAEGADMRFETFDSAHGVSSAMSQAWREGIKELL